MGKLRPSRNSRVPAARRSLWAAFRYLTRAESQTFAFSVAANAILSFFPFFILLFLLVRKVLQSPEMNTALLQLLRDTLPSNQDYVIRALNGLVNARKRVEFFSLLLLMLAARGIFMPLEVALNRIWGFERGRNWLFGQFTGAFLAFSCATLAMVSVALTAGNQYLLHQTFGPKSQVFRIGAFVIMKVCATVASVLIFFMIYWLLPNGPVPLKRVVPAALVAGILWEILKYAYILALPHMNFQEMYGPFAVAVTLIIWAFLSAELLLGGAYLSAREG